MSIFQPLEVVDRGSEAQLQWVKILIVPQVASCRIRSDSQSTGLPVADKLIEEDAQVEALH